MDHGPGPHGRRMGLRLHHWMMTVGDEIDGPDLMAEPVRDGYNLSRTREIGRWRAVSPPRTAALGHRCGGCPHCAARLARAPLRAPQVLRLGFSWPKTLRGHSGYSPRVQCGGGWPQGGWRRRHGLLELQRCRTASPEVLRPEGLVLKVPRSLLKILPGLIASRGGEFGARDVWFVF
jgi:hypothetical protein